MAKVNDVGIFQLESGAWAYRIVINRKDLKYDSTCRQDDFGKPFNTKKAAKEAREKKLYELKTPKQVEKQKDVRLVEVYNKYILSGSDGKAPSTLKKQQSMWDQHVYKNFGERYISEITLGDLKNYLQRLYTYGDDISTHEGGYAYKYVEGFLKFFYLLFGTAYNDDLISHERYVKMFIDRGTRLSMPAMTQEDSDAEEEAAKAYTMAEVLKIEEVFKRGNCYTAFLLGLYLGVRVSECFALRFGDLDLDDKTVTIDKQMLYQDGNFCLVPVKTLASSRVIDLPDILFEHLSYRLMCQGPEIGVPLSAYRNTERVLDKTKAGKVVTIVGGDFINRKPNGELLTINSLKYWGNLVKKETGIDFKYHGLRKTHATMMASQNTPVIELMYRLGHKKYDTTLAYYVNQNHFAKEQLKLHLNNIDVLLEAERQNLAGIQQWIERGSPLEKAMFSALTDKQKARAYKIAQSYVEEVESEEEREAFIRVLDQLINDNKVDENEF